jgi:cyclase
MERVRIIPRLDCKGDNLVKGVCMEGLRVIGKPWDFADFYESQGADELLFMDVVASLYGRRSLLDVVRHASEHLHIPLSVGGGVRSLDDVKTLLRATSRRMCWKPWT